MTAEDRMSLLWAPSPDDTFTLDELCTRPEPTRFVVRPYLPAGCVAVLTGAGGTNKTGLMTLMAIAVCTGGQLFGEAVEGGAVLFVSAEDRRAVVHRHLFANTRDLDDASLRLVAERFHVKDCVGSGFHLTMGIDHQGTIVAPEVGQLIAYANTIPSLRLICLDTLSRLNGAEESNEDLARFVEGMERIARHTGAAVLATHHSGKAQMRADVNDQYSGRGGSALSDNARSVMHVARLTDDSSGIPTNGGAALAEGRLLRLSHVKSNYAAAAGDAYLERVVTEHAARLVPFEPEFDADDLGAIWDRIAAWLATQTEVAYPTRGTVDTLGKQYGARTARRQAIDWAIDRGRVVEEKHPDPKGRRQRYLVLPKDRRGDAAEAYRRARDGE
jgi:RecA-family ATPase